MALQADPCPTCMKYAELPPDYIEELIAAKRSSGVGIADDALYESRLSECKSCAYCNDGIMCVMCGCFVQYRALTVSGKCPHPDGSRWPDSNPT